jgi:hypothetical protein
MRKLFLLAICIPLCYSSDEQLDTDKLLQNANELMANTNQLSEAIEEKVEKCLKIGQSEDVKKLLIKLFEINPDFAIGASRSVIKYSKNPMDAIEPIKQQIEDEFNRDQLVLLVVVRHAQESKKFDESLKLIETERQMLPPDLYLYFHSGLLWLNNDKEGAIKEFSQVSSEYTKATKIGHPIAKNGF